MCFDLFLMRFIWSQQPYAVDDDNGGNYMPPRFKWDREKNWNPFRSMYFNSKAFESKPNIIVELLKCSGNKTTKMMNGTHEMERVNMKGCCVPRIWHSIQ